MRLRSALVASGLMAATAVAVGPLVWMVLTAFKTGPEVHSWPPTLWPREWTGAHFAAVSQTGGFNRQMANSVVVATSTAVLNVLLDSMAAFAFARLRFPGRDAIFGAVLATMMVPAAVTIVPLFLVVRSLPGPGPAGWLDSYAGIVAPSAATAFGIFLFRQYFRTLPRELDEAAMIDGAGPWQVYWHVVMPLSGPAIATVATFSFVMAWNDFLWPLVAATDADMYTVQVGLSYFTTQHSIDWPLLMAAAVIVTFPVLAVYFLLQRHLVAGLTAGAVKE